ncbi:MAG: hypothetical protein ABSC76_00065 [Terracidiphilus sp.]
MSDFRERTVRIDSVSTASVANPTRLDTREFIALDPNIKPRVTIFLMDQANQALMAVKDEAENGSAAILPWAQ